MFVYLLIASELAILYTVFWYLYLREPRQSHKIAGNTWGAYNGAQSTTNGGDAMFGYEMSAAPCYMERGQQMQASGVKPFMLPVQDEMVLDLKTNHYVPVNRPHRTVLGALIHQLDSCLSEMNVRP